MVCKMVKKGVLGAALTAGALYLAFGTSAPSYVRTAFHKVRHNAKDSVPIQFEIDRARDEIASLEPAINEQQARSWPGPRSTSSTSTARSPRSGPTWTTEKKAMLALRESLDDGRPQAGRPRQLHGRRGQGRAGAAGSTTTGTSTRSSRRRRRRSRPGRRRWSPPARS